jgi:hypothetical protein
MPHPGPACSSLQPAWLHLLGAAVAEHLRARDLEHVRHLPTDQQTGTALGRQAHLPIYHHLRRVEVEVEHRPPRQTKKTNTRQISLGLDLSRDKLVVENRKRRPSQEHYLIRPLRREVEASKRAPREHPTRWLLHTESHPWRSTSLTLDENSI